MAGISAKEVERIFTGLAHLRLVVFFPPPPPLFVRVVCGGLATARAPGFKTALCRVLKISWITMLPKSYAWAEAGANGGGGGKRHPGLSRNALVAMRNTWGTRPARASIVSGGRYSKKLKCRLPSLEEGI